MTTQVVPLDKTVTTNKMNLHYLDWGAVGKPVMLLLHGLRGHAHSWDDFSEALCHDYHVLVLDQRGRGDSDWAPDGDYTSRKYIADVAGLCEQLQLDSIILVGHSMGGKNAVISASRFPKQVDKLIVVDAGPEADPRGVARIDKEILVVPEEFGSFEAVVKYMKPHSPRYSDRVLRRYLTYATRELPNGKFQWRYDFAIREQRRRGTAPPPDDLWPVLPQIACPTLIVRGVESDLFGVDVGRRMVEAMADARVAEVPEAGHMVFEDNPEGFIEAVRGFL